jgi:hypothetical protein
MHLSMTKSARPKKVVWKHTTAAKVVTSAIPVAEEYSPEASGRYGLLTWTCTIRCWSVKYITDQHRLQATELPGIGSQIIIWVWQESGRIEILFMILFTNRWQCTVIMLLETICHCLNQVTSYTAQINHGTTQQAKQNLRHLLPCMHQPWVLPYQSQCHRFGSVPQCRHSCKEPESEPAKGLHLEKIGVVCIHTCMRYLDIIHTQCGPLQSDSPLWWQWTVQVTAFISLPVDLTHVEEDKWNTVQLFLRVVHHFNLLTSYTWQRQGPRHTCLK